MDYKEPAWAVAPCSTHNWTLVEIKGGVEVATYELKEPVLYWEELRPRYPYNTRVVHDFMRVLPLTNRESRGYVIYQVLMERQSINANFLLLPLEKWKAIQQRVEAEE